MTDHLGALPRGGLFGKLIASGLCPGKI